MSTFFDLQTFHLHQPFRETTLKSQVGFLTVYSSPDFTKNWAFVA